MEKVITKKGTAEGPVSVILAGVHGNEKCGVKAFDKILPDLSIGAGTVHFIYANPKAIEANERFTELNLNRAFSDAASYSDEQKQTYEYKRAQEIKTHLDKASALLDLHSMKKPSDPFIFCEQNAFDIAQKLPHDFKRIVIGADTVEPGATDGYMNQQGKIGLCVECGQHEEDQAIDLAERTIFEFLKARGHTSDKAQKSIMREKVELTYSYYTQTDSFSLVNELKDFTEVVKSQLIGIDGDQEIKAPFTGLIVFARNCTQKNVEGFLMGKIVS